MTRGDRVGRGVVLLGLAITGAAGSTEVINVDSRTGPAVFYRLRDQASGSYRDNLVVSATRVPDGKGVAR
jgi:hypothetical protein